MQKLTCFLSQECPANEPIFKSNITPTGPALVRTLKQVIKALVAACALPQIPVMESSTSKVFLPGFNYFSKSTQLWPLTVTSTPALNPEPVQKTSNVSLTSQLQHFFANQTKQLNNTDSSQPKRLLQRSSAQYT